MGLEPTASSVHLIQYFHKGVDYIFTIKQFVVVSLWSIENACIYYGLLTTYYQLFLRYSGI